MFRIPLISFFVFLLVPLQLSADNAAHLQLVGTLKGLVNDSTVPEDISDSLLFKEIDRVGKDALTHGRHIEAIKLYEEALAYFKDLRSGNIPYAPRIRVVLGAAYEEVGLWAKAMELYTRVLEEQGSEVEKQKASVCNNIGNIYFKQGEYGKAQRYWDSAIVLNTRLNNPMELVNNYNNLSGLYYMQGDYPKALAVLSQALSQVDWKEDPDAYHLLWMNMAIVYYKMGRSEVAMEMMHSVMDYQRKNQRDLDLILSYQFMAEVCAKRYPDSVFHYLQKALLVSRQLANSKAEISVLKDLYAWYYKRGMYRDACLVMDMRMALQDSLDLQDNRLRMENMEAAYEMTRQQQARELRQKEREIHYLRAQRQRIYLWCGLGVMLVVLIVLGYNYMLQKRLRKRDRELSLRQQHLYVHEKRALESREKELQDSLEIRNRELTSKVLHLIKNNEYIVDINRELQQLLLELNPKDTAKKAHIREMLLKLRDQGNEGTYTEFKYYFEQVHQSFYENVQKAYPMLTYKDLRLCSFLRLGLSSKEIAAITFKEVRSVESARNRLRRKMGLDTDVRLIEFFSQF
ncbi:MAG: tetratricopeptide repeat protein [Bacteroides sp.]|nr:tetratricopeptide repeat protein [Bacteroides sp.]MCM1085990.1 tetratricopeptide repeat protein [Bacteroides sp.]MCM1168594.1 tetratricopeptide repeat protein [Bacteroides sp.]